MQAAETFAKNGCVVFDRIFEPAFIDALRDEYFRQFPDVDANPPEDKYKVGGRRLQLAVKMTGAFLSPDLYANPVLLKFAGAALGEDHLIESLAVVTALAGADAQHLHRDHEDLFAEQPLARAMVGAYAVTVAIPLIDLTPETGTTRLFVGSHRRDRNEEAVELPYLECGRCYAMDYRLWHQGTDNRTSAERPIIYLVYARPWFTDISNYGNNNRINIAADDLASIAEEHRPLFRRLAAKGAFDRTEAQLFAGVPERRP